MKKLFLILPLLVACIAVCAQSTARKFVLKNSADGKSEITVYLPVKPSGKAVVDCPGGGYSHLSMENEGHNWAEYFNAQGIAYCVLQYRMPNGDRNIPLSDAYNAIKTVRDSAKVWNVNPHQVGIMGFSAGGHLASAVSTHAPFEVRPDFSILFYPVISMNERETHKGSCVGFLGDKRSDANLVKEWSSDKAVRRHLTPPAIILLANDDRAVPPVTNGVAYYSAMRRQGNDCTMMIYPTGGHGFGFRDTFKYHDQMLNELTTWLSSIKLQGETDVKVACIGNSITDGHGIDMAPALGYPAVLQSKLGKGYWVKNFGVSSRTAMDKADVPYKKELAWSDCLAWAPDVAIIKLGTNDTKEQNRGLIATDMYNDLKAMVDALRAKNKDVKIYICSPIPAWKDSWTISDAVIVNDVIPVVEKVAKKNKCNYIDLHTAFQPHQKLMLSDGIHPDQKGAAKLAEIIYDAIK